MKTLLLIFVTLCTPTILFAQPGADKPQEVTPAIAQKINDEIAAAIPALKKKYKADDNRITNEEIEFKIDTFKIEKLMKRYFDYDYSTSGMNRATYDAAAKYDSLLNKYYKLLLGKLDAEDRPALVQAQRSWISFRDNELKLEDNLRKEKYSGGGTMQSMIYASKYIDIIKQRAITIARDYLDIVIGY